MTWKEFKEQVEAQGVTDEMEVLYIDWHGGGVIVQPTVERTPDNQSFTVE